MNCHAGMLLFVSQHYCGFMGGFFIKHALSLLRHTGLSVFSRKYMREDVTYFVCFWKGLITMCGFAGFSDYDGCLREEKYLWMALARRMASRISHRGPDDSGEHVSGHCALSHARLAVIDPQRGAQPMTKIHNTHSYTIAYNGEVYNANELKRELISLGYHFQTECDTEVVLTAYIHYGEDCAEKLNGIFAFAIDDIAENKTFLCRDRFGVKPLFYTFLNGRLVFGSEIKALFEYPGINPVIKKEGLCEIFGLGPARTPGNGVFDGIQELLPGHIAVFSKDGFKARPYFDLKAVPHTDTYPETVEKVRDLLLDTINRQLISDVPLCTFLSGGLDSSVITAMAQSFSEGKGIKLDTYSFEFEGNDKYFKSSAFQPDRDEEWADKVSDLLSTNHTKLLCSNKDLADSLYDGVIAKDLPGMADIDGSLLYFCRQVKQTHDVVLCGECADEIFGGYPWFHRPEMFDGSAFPWSNNLDTRASFLKPEIRDTIAIDDYVGARLEESLKSVPVLTGESETERRMRQINYLSIRWFMATLLDRKDRCSMASGLEVRVPFADHRLAEYVFNVPWQFKCPDGVNKGLLRDASRGFLPDDVLFRKKSPYPKTHNPGYELILKNKLKYILSDSLQPIHKILSEDVVKGLLTESFDYGSPWFGQLMAGPQMLAYLIQINYWLLHYNIYVDLS